MQTYFLWKVDIWGFPTICCMTHFEYQKASKIAFENRVKKLCARANFHANRHVAGTVARARELQ
jgi:hypothetical protein